MTDVKRCTRRIRTRDPHDQQPNTLITRLPTATADSTENLWYLCTVVINVYVCSWPDPDPTPGGRGQPANPNECNSTLTSGTNNIYPYPYIDVNDRGHCFRSGSPLGVYPAAALFPQKSSMHKVLFNPLRHVHELQMKLS